MDICVSASSGPCTDGNAYYVVVKNVGSSAVAAGIAELHFSETVTGDSLTLACTIGAAVSPGNTYVCSNGGSASWPEDIGIANGDTIFVKLVNPDGRVPTASVKSEA